VFAVGTEKDHIAPWRSVYKVHLYFDTDISFVLTAGGHNAGIVSEPGRARRNYRITSRNADELYIHPEVWRDLAPVSEGSWWPAWQQWLAQHSSGKNAPPKLGAPARGFAPIEDAPGRYVHQD
jgi:polyhydroxyalkanoate synthase